MNEASSSKKNLSDFMMVYCSSPSEMTSMTFPLASYIVPVHMSASLNSPTHLSPVAHMIKSEEQENDQAPLFDQGGECFQQSIAWLRHLEASAEMPIRTQAQCTWPASTLATRVQSTEIQWCWSRRDSRATRWPRISMQSPPYRHTVSSL